MTAVLAAVGSEEDVLTGEMWVAAGGRGFGGKGRVNKTRRRPGLKRGAGGERDCNGD